MPIAAGRPFLRSHTLKLTDGPAALTGLVLAGGRSSRMGTDKGSLEYAGVPQARRTWKLLQSYCAEVCVSIREDQKTIPAYVELPLVVDEGRIGGPAAGLLAAWSRKPAAALLVLAVDMPLVDELLLSELVACRDPGSIATAFAHVDGTIEPLCTIWEPAARDEILALTAAGSPSLRRILEASAPRLVVPSDPGKLVSVNSPAEYTAVGRGPPSG